MLPDLKSIKKRREKLGIRQYDLAKRAGISQSMLAKIESERNNVKPGYDVAGRIFEELEKEERADEKTAKDVMHKGVKSLDVKDTFGRAAKLAKEHGISQFPVLDGSKIVGSIRTIDIMDMPKEMEIGWKFGIQLPAVDEAVPISSIKELVKHSQAVVVMRKGEIVGIITAEDLI